MTFWILAVLFAAAAVGFALAPFLRPAFDAWRSRAGAAGFLAPEPGRGAVAAGPSPSQPDRADALRALYRQRLEELRDETAAGILEEASRSEIEQELGQGLLDEFYAADEASRRQGGDGRRGEKSGPDNSGAETQTPPAAGEPDGAGAAVREDTAGRRFSNLRVWQLAGVALPLLAVLLYLQVGEPDAGVLSEAPVVLELHPERDRLELDRWRVLLASRLDRSPDDAQSRYLLGRIHLKDGEYEQAAEAFARTHAAVGEDPGVDLVWLQALYLGNEGRLDTLARRIAGRILSRDPGQPMVLEILAIDAYRQGDYRESVGLFSRALAHAVEPRQRMALDLFLTQARSMLGDMTPSIDVRLKALAPPPDSATLFVIARPVGGGMPFAVVRRAATPLPEIVRLDDAVTMNPALPLSAAGEVEVVVRISLTGAAMHHPGDWQWRSEPFVVTGVDNLGLVAEIGPPAVAR